MPNAAWALTGTCRPPPPRLPRSYHWHHRNRSQFAESFHNCDVELVRAGAGRQQQSHVLFSMELQDSGYQKRSLLAAPKLSAMAAHLLGRKGLLSNRNAFALAHAASGVPAVRSASRKVEWALRVNR